MKTPKGYRTCFVPMCFNTSKRTPDKLFFFVPRDEKIRNLWFRLASRTDLPTSKTHYFCCEDHFNFKEDMENYVRFSLIGGPLKLKPNVVPHKFDCCRARKRPPILKPRRQLSEKKRNDKEDAIPAPLRRCSSEIGQSEKESNVNESEEEGTSNQFAESVLSTIKVEINSELDPTVSSQNATSTINQFNRIDNLDQVSQENKSTDDSNDESHNRIENLNYFLQDDSDDKYDAFGKLIAMQLRQLQVYNALSCEKQILSIIIKQRLLVISKQDSSTTSSASHLHQVPCLDDPEGEEPITNRLLDSELDSNASSSKTKRKPRILKRKRLSKSNPVSSEHDNIIDNPDQVSQINQCADYSDDDEYDAFGKLVAIQLRQLPLYNALICQEKIQTLIKEHRLQSSSVLSEEIMQTEIKQEPPTSPPRLNFIDIKTEKFSDTESITDEFA